MFICARYLSIVTAPPIFACAVVALVGGSFIIVLAADFMLWFRASSLSYGLGCWCSACVVKYFIAYDVNYGCWTTQLGILLMGDLEGCVIMMDNG